MGQGALGPPGAAPLGASDGPLPAQPLPIQNPSSIGSNSCRTSTTTTTSAPP